MPLIDHQSSGMSKAKQRPEGANLMEHRSTCQRVAILGRWVSPRLTLGRHAYFDQAADRFGTIREVILAAAPLVEALQRFGLQSNADQLARLSGPGSPCFRVITV